jgi:hypothetical protein
LVGAISVLIGAIQILVGAISMRVGAPKHDSALARTIVRNIARASGRRVAPIRVSQIARTSVTTFAPTQEQPIAPTRVRNRTYFNVPAPAAAVTASCCEAPPDAPIAPMILPPTISGNPPSTAVAPSSERIRQPSPPAASAS